MTKQLSPSPTDDQSRLSHISIEDLQLLNAYAKSGTKRAEMFLWGEMTRLEHGNDSQRMCGKFNHLVVGGRGILKRSYREMEDILDAPEDLRHPVEQVSACLAILRRSRGQIPLDQRYSRDEVQRRLSHILVEYPILMHHRLLFAVGIPHAEWAGLGVAIAEASYARLPTLADGLTPKQLKTFACNDAVKTGLRVVTPSFLAIKAPSLNGLNALDVCTNDMKSATPASDPLATRGGFVSSFLALSNIARNLTGQPILEPRLALENADKLSAALGRAIWDQALHQGANGAVSLEELKSTLALPSPFEDEETPTGLANATYARHTVATAVRPKSSHECLLTHGVAGLVSEKLFDSPRITPEVPDPSDVGEDVLLDRTRKFVTTAVALGLAADKKSAGEWLAAMTVGPYRRFKAGPGPLTVHSNIVGFLRGLHEVGVSVELEDKVPNINTPATAQSWQTWTTAHQVFVAQQTMEDVYAKHEAVAAAPGPATVPPPPSRGRRRQV